MNRSIWRDPFSWGIVACLFILIVLGIEFARAQEHEHGVDNLPDWYDPSCCNQRDCKAVPDSEIEFFTEGGSGFVRHVPTGAVFQQSQWKISQDERYHVCIWNGNPLCVYIRAGV